MHSSSLAYLGSNRSFGEKGTEISRSSKYGKVCIEQL